MIIAAFDQYALFFVIIDNGLFTFHTENKICNDSGLHILPLSGVYVLYIWYHVNAKLKSDYVLFFLVIDHGWFTFSRE